MKKILQLLLSLSILFGNTNSLRNASLAMSEGDYKAALTFVNKAQTQDKKNPEVYRMKGLLLEALDEPGKALNAWKKCLKYSKNKVLSSEAKIHIQNLETKK